MTQSPSTPCVIRKKVPVVDTFKWGPKEMTTLTGTRRSPENMICSSCDNFRVIATRMPNV